MSGNLPLPPQGPPGPMPGMPPPGMMPPGIPGRPPPLPPMPNLVPQGMRPESVQFDSEQMLTYLVQQPRPRDLPDSDQDLPANLRRYAAGLRPTPKPPGVPWQQEIVFERLGKTDQEIETIARFYFGQAQNYDTSLSQERMSASQYYAGRPLGDETTGRSQIVLTVVRDTIRSTLPSLLRVFTAVEDPVSFDPISSEIAGNDKLATMLSRQATDY